jgi:hypothetical protein
MTLGKFIKTTIYDYLNEQVDEHEHEHEDEDNLNSNFTKWFSGSKVVYNDKPLIVYHGSTEEFEEFIGDSFFTPDYFNADGYANGECVYEVYLSIKRPLMVDCKDKKWDEIESEYGETTVDIVKNVDRSKYDGIIFLNIKDAWFDDEEYQDSDTVYVTFQPNQIKSVENEGDWDINDDNIYG